jgi:hypothetical protein
LDSFLGLKTRSGGIDFADGLYDLVREMSLAEGFHKSGRRAVPPLSYILEFALLLRKSTSDLNQMNRVFGDYSMRRLYCFFRYTFDWPAEQHSPSVTRGGFQSAVGQQKCLSSRRTKRFPASACFWLRMAISAVIWPSKNRMSKSSRICWIPTYRCALVAMRTRLDFKACNASSGPPDSTRLIRHMADIYLVSNGVIAFPVK